MKNLENKAINAFSFDMRDLRRCFSKYATGVTVVTSKSNGTNAGVTANSFSSLSLDPPLILWSIGRKSRSFEIFRIAENFSINILSFDQIDISQQFASAEVDKFRGVGWSPGLNGAPILDGIAGFLECSREAVYDGGDHIIIVGRVTNYARFDKDVLLFVQGRYCLASDHPAAQQDQVISPSQNDDGELRTSLMLDLMLAHHSLSANFDKHRREEGLNVAQGRILRELDVHGPLDLGALVTRTYTSQRSTEDALADLVARGEVFSEDTTRYVLTAKGRERRQAMLVRVAEFEAKITSRFSAGELAATRRILRALVTDAEIGVSDR